MILDDMFETSTYLCLIGVALYISYKYLYGFYKRDAFIDIIKYFGAFTVGYLILKSLININHTISIEQDTVQVQEGIYRVGAWIFHIESIAKAAESLTHVISNSAVGSATASASILLSAMMFHSRMLMGGWRSHNEVVEAFFISLVTFFCLSYFDVFFNTMTSLLDEFSNIFFGDDLYARYAETMAPMNMLLVQCKTTILEASVWDFTKLISSVVAGFYIIILFIFSCVNFILFSIQYLCLMGIPLVTIIFTFMSGIDPFRPIRITGAVVLLTFLSKLQIFFLASMSRWTIHDYSGSITEMNNDIVDGAGFVGDNFFLLLKLVGGLAFFILIIALVSWKMFDFILNVIGVNQFAQLKSVMRKG
ncbi:hypothetical protein GCL60_09815 [Silvanigrella paludirubra]|uniref:Uncharacterized protein n=1 Tax=Silvanigrella paludirubra TaxID=2499159 RepID=A0A6N6VSN7_9BACT|nr:hypothetical protein [Silvanigrella paludirubra]KAB8039142.1 hypothetical protein GCL60_09815 [Silvanigrella paludirubra]